METFRTTFPVPPAPFGISHTDRVLMVGSCFTENIGAKLVEYRFPALINPFGTVYNPVSMARCLERLLVGNTWFREEEMARHAGVWHSWEWSNRFAAPGLEDALVVLNERYHEAAEFLHGSNRLLLALGTADVFVLRETGQVVANCHKAPAALFEERRLSVAETVGALEAVLQKLKNQLPALQIVLTVSPVRHWRKGPVANQRSKATLVLACAELCERLPFVYYFPAYELLLDDLRDYRFYTPDLLHPSQPAVDYIWLRFGDAFFSAKTKQVVSQLGKIAAALRHRAIHPESAEHRAFVEQQLQAIAQLMEAEPGLDLSAEAAWLRQST